MADYLFVSQEMLDTWMLEGKIDFSGNVMTIRGDKRSYVLEPAVRFVRIPGDIPDTQNLLGKVKTLAQIEEAGGEHFETSVILGDVPYDVQNGFVARVNLPGGHPRPEAAVERPAPAAPSQGAPAAAGVGDASPGHGGRPSASEAAAPAAETRGAGEAESTEPSDEDLLTAFLLENLK
ncbi:MAG: hypothetical protein D6729_07475 [Deltaproteobacteria bacterium]|nr:MAG: hypothetical protein D6729_07475 [Deltaproteobacteria bacterium]